MSGQNSVIISGVCLKDPVLAKTRSGVDATNFMIRASYGDRDRKRIVAVRVNAFGGAARAVESQMISKGDYVIVHGELMNRDVAGAMSVEVRAHRIVAFDNTSPHDGDDYDGGNMDMQEDYGNE